MTTTTILLIIVAIVIVGIGVFSWRFENVGDDTTQDNAKDDTNTPKN